MRCCFQVSRKIIKGEIGIAVRVKVIAGTFRKSWLTRDTEKKEANVMYRQLGSSKSLEEWKRCQNTLKRKSGGQKKDLFL